MSWLSLCLVGVGSSCRWLEASSVTMYVCMYVYVCVYICVCMCVCVYVCVCVLYFAKVRGFKSLLVQVGLTCSQVFFIPGFLAPFLLVHFLLPKFSFLFYS